MPTYTFRDKDTGELYEPERMTIAEMEQTLRDNSFLELVPAAPLIHSGRGLSKPDDGFRDLLKEIKGKHPRSTINTF